MRALRALVAVAVIAAAGWYGWTHRDELFGRLGLDPHTRAPPSTAPEPTPADAPDARPVGGRPRFDPAGKAIEVTLLYPPVATYLDPSVDDDEYRGLVEALAGPGIAFDPHLSRAAREVAYQVGVLGGPPPEALLSFLLHSSGAPELTTKEWFLHTNDDSPVALRELLEQALRSRMRGHGTIRVGVGEVSTPGERHTRHIAVLLTRREYEVEPAPRLAPTGSEWMLRGTLPPGYRSPSATVMWPDGTLGTAEVAVDGESFQVAVPTRDEPGTIHVSMGGVGRDGPGKLLQLTVEVGDELPRTFATVVPEADPAFGDVAAAEAYALELLNRDRARFGLPALAIDPDLCDIARAHSEDMRDHGFFGHRSPNTGLPSDRLAAAGYRARTHSENVALNDTLGESEHALMASIGHRRNILDPSYTHVGIGVARKTGRDGRDQIHLTQLFAQPVEDIDEQLFASELLDRINAARVKAGAEPLAANAALAALAYQGARDASDGPIDSIPANVAERVRLMSSRGASVSVYAVFGPDQLDVPPPAVAREATSIGIGVVQSPTDPQGRIGVVLIVEQ